MTAQDTGYTAPLERKTGLTIFYKHFAPLELKSWVNAVFYKHFVPTGLIPSAMSTKILSVG